MKKLGKGLLFGCAVGIPLALMAFLVLSHRHGDCTLGSERIIAPEAQGESPEHLPEAGTPGAGDRQEGSSPSSGEQEHSSPEGPAEETDNASSVRLLFAGDILFTEVPLSRYRSGGIGTFVSDAVLEEMERADIFMLNEEFPFSTRGTAAPDKQFTFQVDPSHVSIFQELSVDVATIANNHALDFGTDAFLDTLDTLDKAGIARVGGGRNREEAASPAILEAGGMRIAFFGASRVIPVASWNAGEQSPGMLTAYDSTLLEEKIRSVREDCDYIVVYLHWGVEKDSFPQDYQRELGRRLIDAGADAVIGSHPHVVQGFEFYNGKPILYSLGNFLFSNSANDTFLCRLTLSRDAAGGSGSPIKTSVRILPCQRVDGQMRFLDDPSSYYSYLTSLSYGVSVATEGEEAGLLVPSPQ